MATNQNIEEGLVRSFNEQQIEVMDAIENNDLEKLKNLAICKCFDFQARDGNSPLYTAVKENKLEIIKILISGKADPNRPNSDDFYKTDFNDNPYLLAIKLGNKEVISAIKKYGVNEDAKYDFHMREAVKEDSVEKIKYLIENGYNLDYEGDYTNGPNGFNALLEATNSGSRKVIEYLLGEGVDINFSRNGHTGILIDSAVVNDDLDLVRFLHHKGAEIDDSAVISAVKRFNLDMVKYLIENSKDQKQAIENATHEARWTNETFNLEVLDYIASIKVREILISDFDEMKEKFNNSRSGVTAKKMKI